MSDELPDYVKLKLYKKVLTQVRQQKQQDQLQQEDPEKIVYSKLADERAVELMDKLKSKYPDVYRVVINELYKAIKNGLLSSIDGLTVYGIINTLGLDIKPEIKLKFVKHGKEVDLREYMS